MSTQTAKRAGQRRKDIAEVVAYAVSHRTRVQILIVLNQGVYTAGEIAGIIGEPLNKVGNHMRELLDAGSIEIADTKRRRNTELHFYRATQTPYFSDQAVEAMTWQQRQVTAGLVIQSLMAEMMAALWVGKMHDDPRVWLAWDRLNLDAQGRQEVADEQEDSWKRMEAIKVNSANRIAESGEETVPYIVSVLGFERALKAPTPSHSAGLD